MMRFIFLLLLFTLHLLQSVETNWSSAQAADDQLNRLATELEQALEEIASLDKENDYLAEQFMTTAGEKRELEQENEQLKKKLKHASNGEAFYSKLVPISYVTGGIEATVVLYAKKDTLRIDSIVLETIGKIITNPDIARAVASRFPSLYKWQTTCCNNTVSMHINPMNFAWTTGESFYNYKYHYKSANDAASSGTGSKNALQLTACQLAKKLVHGVHITVENDPIAPLPGTTWTVITTDQLVRSVLKATVDEVEHVVNEANQPIQEKKKNNHPSLPQHFAMNLATQVASEAAYNIFAQTAHGLTRNSDYNYYIELLFPADLQQRKTEIQSWTKFVIKYLLINGTPYLYQKLHAEPSAT